MKVYFNHKKVDKNFSKKFQNNEIVSEIKFLKKKNELSLNNSDYSYKQIFYKLKKDDIYIFENLGFHKSSELNLEKLAEWLMFAGRSFDNKTIFKDIKILLPGEKLKKTKKKLLIRNKIIKSYIPNKNINKKTLIKALSNSLNNNLKKFKGNILFGLSGGADSRLLLSLINKKYKKKVICYNYGENHNYEKIISNYIANYLGFRFINIKVNEEEYIKNIIEGLRLSSYGSTFQHSYQISLFKKLKKKTKSNYVILGSALDLFLGSTFSDSSIEKIKNNKSFISWFEKKFSIFTYKEIKSIFKHKLNIKKKFRDNLSKIITSVKFKNYYDLNDAINFETRILRWYNRNLCYINKNLVILNPTYDKNFINLSFKVPNKLRKGSKFRFDLLKESNKELSEIILANNLLPPKNFKGSYKNKINSHIKKIENLKLLNNLKNINNQEMKSSLYDVNLGHKFISSIKFKNFAIKTLKLCKTNVLCQKILNHEVIEKIYYEHINLKKDNTKKIIFLFSLIYILYDNSKR